MTELSLNRSEASGMTSCDKAHCSRSCTKKLIELSIEAEDLNGYIASRIDVIEEKSREQDLLMVINANNQAEERIAEPVTVGPIMGVTCDGPTRHGRKCGARLLDLTE